MIVPNAQAATFTYDFGFRGVFIAFDPVSGDDFHFGSDSSISAATLVFDDVAQTAAFSVTGFGDVVDSTTGAVITTGTSFTYDIAYTGVTGDPLSPNLQTASNGVGSYTIANVGNIDGVAGNDSVSGQVETHMLLLGGDTLLTNTPGEGINNGAWFHGIGDTLVNGTQANALFNATGGDNDFNFGVLQAEGADVPEPMTAALLGLGMLGGAIRRKKSQ